MSMIKKEKLKKDYESPRIKVMNVAIEKGFALSTTFPAEEGNMQQKIRYNYTLNKVNNGGRAW